MWHAFTRFFFCTIVSKLAEEQWTHPGQGLRNPLSEGHRWTSPGKSWSKLTKTFVWRFWSQGQWEREISHSLMTGSSLLCGWSRGRLPSQGVLHMTLTQAPRNAMFAEKGLKRGQTTMKLGFLTTDSSRADACMLSDFLLGLLPETCCFLLDLPWHFFLVPACCPRLATLLLLFPPALLPRTIRTACNGTLLDPGGDYPCFMKFLLLSYLFYRPPSLPHHPNL